MLSLEHIRVRHLGEDPAITFCEPVGLFRVWYLGSKSPWIVNLSFIDDMCNVSLISSSMSFGTCHLLGKDIYCLSPYYTW